MEQTFELPHDWSTAPKDHWSRMVTPENRVLFRIESGAPDRRVNFLNVIRRVRDDLGLRELFHGPHLPGVDLLVVCVDSPDSAQRIAVAVRSILDKGNGTLTMPELSRLEAEVKVQPTATAFPGPVEPDATEESLDQSAVVSEEGSFGRTEKRPRAFLLSNENELKALHYLLLSAFHDAGFTERIYDESGTAFYQDEDPGLREEPVMLDFFALAKESNMMQLKVVLRIGAPHADKAAQIIRAYAPVISDLTAMEHNIEYSQKGAKILIFNFAARRELS